MSVAGIDKTALRKSILELLKSNEEFRLAVASWFARSRHNY
jgi:hypothetical protein